jgi:hypothetical protein
VLLNEPTSGTNRSISQRSRSGKKRNQSIKSNLSINKGYDLENETDDPNSPTHSTGDLIRLKKATWKSHTEDPTVNNHSMKNNKNNVKKSIRIENNDAEIKKDTTSNVGKNFVQLDDYLRGGSELLEVL